MDQGLFVKVIRKTASYHYKRNSTKPDDWYNNDNNNMLDTIILYVFDAELIRMKAQTVANIPGGRFKDTIVPGKFQIEAFVENRNFYGRIHGIINAYDYDGQLINNKSIQPVIGKDGAPIDYKRWLCHDTQKCKPKPPMDLTRVAWSSGCFITTPDNLTAWGEIWDGCHVLPGNKIDGILVEEA